MVLSDTPRLLEHVEGLSVTDDPGIDCTRTLRR